MPFYVGKGTRERYLKHFTEPANDDIGERLLAMNHQPIIVSYPDRTNEHALFIERLLIALYGRQDIGTGVLLNHSAGGEAGVIGEANPAKSPAA